MADADSIVMYGLLAVVVEFAVLAFLAKKISDELAASLGGVSTRLERLRGLIERIDSERQAAAAASSKKVGRLALEKIFSEAIDFISAMLSKRPA